MYIATKQKLRELYSMPKVTALEKELPELTQQAIDFIKSSPFIVISTFDAEGKINISPRGGEVGFVNVLNNKTLIIPDAKGNNRIDSLVNIVDTGKIGCLFLVQDSNQTLRINGNARVSVSEQYLNLSFGLSKPPTVCIELTIADVFLHCSKSLVRSKLWKT